LDLRGRKGREAAEHCIMKINASQNITRVIKSRKMRWAGYVTRMGEVRIAYNILVGEPERKGPLGRPRRIWEDNIKMYLREI
jgi:hypothetical protein